MFKQKKVTLIVSLVCSLLLNSCNSEKEVTAATTEIPRYFTNSANVRALIANATVNVFKIDTDNNDLKGILIAPSQTNDAAQMVELLIYKR